MTGRTRGAARAAAPSLGQRASAPGSRLAVVLALVLGLWLGPGLPLAAQSVAGPVRFAVIGDAPYFPFEGAMMSRLVAKLDEVPLDFVIHIGDLKASFEPCTDTLLRARIAQLDASSRPVVYTPGDNDWTDCHRERAGGHDPLERLDALRRIAYPTPTASLGRRRLALVTQAAGLRFAERVENARWQSGDVLFVTVHVPGSNNNYARTGDADREHVARMEANLAWLEEARVLAGRPEVRALVVAFHADPRFDSTVRRRDGFATLRAQLATIARTIAKPVVLVHGDSHRFTFDQPLVNPRTGRAFENVWRVQSFGSPTVAAVLVTIDPAAVTPVRVVPFQPAPETTTQ